MDECRRFELIGCDAPHRIRRKQQLGNDADSHERLVMVWRAESGHDADDPRDAKARDRDDAARERREPCAQSEGKREDH